MPWSEELIVRTDPVRVQQVVINLLQNAIKFSHDSDKISVLVEKDYFDMSIRIRVVDSGIGISERDQ